VNNIVGIPKAMAYPDKGKKDDQSIE